MGIPNKISPLTGGDILPRGYIPADFLESTTGGGKDAAPTIQVEDELPWSCGFDIEYEYTKPYANSTWSFVLVQYAAESNSYTFPPRVWDYNAMHVNRVIKVADFSGRVRALMNYKNSGKLIFNNQEISLNSVTKEGGAPIFLFKGFKGRIWAVRITENSEIIRDLMPCLDDAGKPCFYDKITRTAFYNTDGRTLVLGLTLDQALNLRKLPIVTSGTLTISLPWEAQWDTGVQNALAVAATRGWTITVQYRDPEIATTNIPASFLESTGTQYIDTEVLSGTLSFDAVVSGCAGSSCCIIGGRMNDAYGNNILGSVGRKGWQFVYNSHLQHGTLTYQPLKKYHVQSILGTLLVDGVVASKTGDGNFSYSYSLFAFANNRNNEEVTLLTSMQMWYLTIKDNLNTPVRMFVPVLDPQGIPCFYDKVTKQTFYNSGSGSFIAGFDTVEQSRNLAYLPDVTAETDSAKKSLTVSLPWEAQLVQHNAEAEAALQTAKSRGWTITVQYRDPVADSAVYNKYAACTTVADMQAVNPNYKRDLTADGEWEYPLNSIVDGSKMFGFYTAYMKRGYFYFPNMITATDFANGGSSLVEAEVYAPKATSLRYLFHDQKNLKKLSGDFSKLEQAVEFLCNTSIVDLEADFPSLVDASYFALNCNSSTVYRPQLNKASVLRILNSIPSYASGSHRLGIGIHVDNQSDDDVLAAIADAESKGWTLTVQWNGTATAQTASTFGLRKPPIYAKLGTMERLDGSTVSVLDWGHYVTDWEANGYQEFASVEEAEEYFNINQAEEV
jgi:hypothetical protein